MQFFEAYINYRNSKEIADYYFTALRSALPTTISSELPVFSCGDVLVHSVKDQATLPMLVADTIAQLKRDYYENEIGIVCLGAYKLDFKDLSKRGIHFTTDLKNNKNVLITIPRCFRGHEKKAVIVCSPKVESIKDKIGKAINAYIAYSRARDRLIIFEY